MFLFCKSDLFTFAFSATLLRIPSSRILIGSINPLTGDAVVDLLSSALLTPEQQSGGMWDMSLDVCGMTSISTANATELLNSCGMEVDWVVVTGGTHVSFRSSNASDVTVACLQNHTLVCNATVSRPRTFACMHDDDVIIVI